MQSVPYGVWVQLDDSPRLYVWHDNTEQVDVLSDDSGNVFISAACIIRIGPPTSANVENKAAPSPEEVATQGKLLDKYYETGQF